ncbi:MAG: VUT family protein [Rhodospirillales bacterium]|nr:VUT family protein [Rhodospirillales bacterium]
MPYMFTALYIASIVLVNWAFTVVPPIPIPGGALWPPVALVVGFVFVLRDFAQREIGHWVLGAMLLGAFLSYGMAGRQIALASAAAFLVSEIADWAVYTWTKRPIGDRVLLSSAIAAPLDSIVFLAGIGFLSFAGVAAMTISKILGAVVVWAMIRRREMA